jgi:hypothetical protein
LSKSDRTRTTGPRKRKRKRSEKPPQHRHSRNRRAARPEIRSAAKASRVRGGGTGGCRAERGAAREGGGVEPGRGEEVEGGYGIIITDRLRSLRGSLRLGGAAAGEERAEEHESNGEAREANGKEVGAKAV